MQIFDCKNNALSGAYTVPIKALEVDSFENDIQRMEYLVSEEALPDSIRCNMIYEFEAEHKVDYLKCKNAKWSIVEMQNPEYYLSLSCASPDEKEHETMTMVKLSLNQEEIKILEHTKSKFLSFEGLTDKQVHAVERIVNELKDMNSK